MNKTNKQKASIFDYNRLCASYYDNNCEDCPLEHKICMASPIDVNEMNDIILEWVAANPEPQKITNLSLLRQIFPHYRKDEDFYTEEDCPELCPTEFDIGWNCSAYSPNCAECMNAFWSKERKDIELKQIIKESHNETSDKG